MHNEVHNKELKYKKAKFIGHKGNLKKEIVDIGGGFPYFTYLDDNNLPVLFANDEEGKEQLFKECKEFGIEIIDGTIPLERKDA